MNINLKKIILKIYNNPNLIKKYKIYKIKKEYCINIVSKLTHNEKPSRKYTDIELINSKKLFIDTPVEEFLQKLSESNVDEECLITFYNNLILLNIKIIKGIKAKLNIKFGIDAEFFYKQNLIKIYNDNPESYYHELFHVFSNRNEKSGGFCEKRKNLEIGIGLDEGYTEYLVEKYFSLNRDYAFFTNKAFVKCLEKIIGEQQMIKLYAIDGLYGLFNKLKEYSDIDSLEKFINDTDFIHNYDDKKNLSEFEILKLNNCICDSSLFLIECYAKKLKQNNFSKEQYKNYKSEFLNYIIDIFVNLNCNNLFETIKYHNDYFEQCYTDDLIDYNK